MELEKIRNLSDEELAHQEKVTSEQLFRHSLSGLAAAERRSEEAPQLRKEIAQIKTVARERELGIRGAAQDAAATADAKTGNTKGAR